MKLKLPVIYLLIVSLIYSCTSSLFLESHEDKLIPVNENPDSAISAIIAPYKIGIDSIMDEVLCYSKLEMRKGKSESLLGNFVTDLCLKQFSDKADICIMNNGGLRSILPEGKITRRDIYTLMPFENELVIIELDSVERIELFKYIASRGEPFSGGLVRYDNHGDIRSLLKSEWETIRDYGLDGDCEKDPDTYKDWITHMNCYASGKEIIELMDSFKVWRDPNVSIRKNKIQVLTSDYLANGGDKMKFFKGKKQNKVGVKVREAIINYCLEVDTISSYLDGRIYLDERK